MIRIASGTARFRCPKNRCYVRIDDDRFAVDSVAHHERIVEDIVPAKVIARMNQGSDQVDIVGEFLKTLYGD